MNLIAGLNNPLLEKGVPMMCFCDIPLSNVTKHSKIYGRYAIGLRKGWGTKNNINPIIYTYINSEIANQFFHLSGTLWTNKDDSIKQLNNHLAHIFSFVKPYEGPFMRHGQSYPNFRFYDEREWRYVPKFQNAPVPGPFPPWLKKDINFSEESLKKLNQEILHHKLPPMCLRFGSEDIKHIVLDKENEIQRFVDDVMDLNSSKFRLKDLQMLLTKVISLDGIIDDF